MFYINTNASKIVTTNSCFLLLVVGVGIPILPLGSAVGHMRDTEEVSVTSPLLKIITGFFYSVIP